MDNTKNKVIITVVGKDTVGIIAKVCTYLAESHINILDISQTIVQEYFNLTDYRFRLFQHDDDCGYGKCYSFICRDF